MHVIWKRPDGFHNAQPSEFKRVKLSNGAQFWLHNYEIEWYPFQVSGDWAGQEQTKRLNKLVNLLDSSDTAWKSYLDILFDNEFSNDTTSYAVQGICSWLEDIKTRIRGNTWELEIVVCALNDVQSKIRSLFVL